MTTDIFEFWQQIAPNDHIHPDDSKVFERVPNHGFDTKNALPGSFMGPLKTARIVLLYLSPGSSDADKPTAKLTEWHQKNRSGLEPLISEEVHASAFRWWRQRTKFLGGTVEQRASHVAILNIGAYHSKTFNDHG